MFRFTTIILISLLVFVAAAIEAQAKAPPPGSGAADVPANILIMLDTSGSMGEILDSGDSRYPMDVAFDSAGNAYVAKYYDQVEKYDSSGEFVTAWGEYDGTYGNGKFDFTYSIDVDSNDNVYVADYLHGRVQKFDSDGNFLDKFSVSGSRIYGIAIDSSDNIYAINGNGNLEKFDSDGNKIGSTWTAVDDGTHVAIDDATGNVYVTSFNDEEVEYYTSTGTYLGRFTTYENGTSGSDYRPTGIEFGTDGYIYISDYYDGQIYQYNSTGTPTGTKYGSWGSSVGKFKYPRGIAEGPDGEMYVADYSNHRVQTAAGVLYISGVTKTRLEAAQNVIKTIVSDSNLTNGANFGLMKWNSSGQEDIIVEISDTGAAEIFNTIDTLSDGGSTYLEPAMNLASSYYLGSDTPIDPAATDCQQNIIIVISDGFWFDSPNPTAQTLYDDYDIKTFTIGFATTGNTNYTTLSQAGGTYPDSPLYAENEATLLDVLSGYIRQIIATQLTFTVPTIIPGIANDDHILQSTFSFKENNQWKGRLYKYELDDDGFAGDLIWDAGDELNDKAAASRNIWTVAQGLSHSTNNFTTANVDRLQDPMEENSGTAMTEDEIDDLINFVRGVDSYGEFPAGIDDEGETLISGERWKLADIYHSKAVVIGAPSAFFSDEVSTKTESYYRYLNGYKNFRDGNSCGGSCANRDEVVYVGSNSGMLHAFDSATGEEKWAFIPPSVLPNLRTMVSNEAAKSVSIYGVDGSPIVKDIYVNGAWKTVLLSGLRQGGHSYFALDITDPNAPTHMFTFAYNSFSDTVSYWDEDNIRTDYDASGTVPEEYDFSDLGESWSDPLIMRIPYLAGTEKWVGVFSAGYNNNINPDFGDVLYVIDLSDGGKILEKIEIGDNDSSDNIQNSTPSRLTAITADTTTTFPHKGAHLYFTDLEGSVWKINLSDSGTLFDKVKIMDMESTLDNDRLSFHNLSSSILNDGTFMSYIGTADMMRIGRVDSDIQNRGYGFKDPDYPTFNSSFSSYTISSMLENYEGSTVCPSGSEYGWYYDFDANEKITAKANVTNSNVIFSRYTPDSTDLCSAGTSKISEHDFACGTNERETDLGPGMATEAIVYKNKLYIGISSDAVDSGSLPTGFVKQGNLIIGDPNANEATQVEVEYWQEN